MSKIFHAFVNPVADAAGFSGTKPSDWNAPLEYGNFSDTGPSGTDVVARRVLTGNIVIYFRTDGSNSAGRDGLSNTSGSAFLTAQYAYEFAVANYDWAGFDVTIRAGEASISRTVSTTINTGWVGSGTTSFDWNGGSVTTTSDNCFYVPAFLSGSIHLSNVTFSTVTSGNCVYHAGNNYIYIESGVTFGACANYHIYSAGFGSISCFNNYTISGGANTHAVAAATAAALTIQPTTVTVTGFPSFTGQFAWSLRGGYLQSFTSFVDGSAHTRHDATANTHSNTTLDNIVISGGGDTSSLTVGMYIVGSGIPAGTTIQSIGTATSLTMSAAAGSSLTGTAIAFEIASGYKSVVQNTGGVNTFGSGASYFPGTLFSSPDSTSYYT